jgi:hypothetical protein
MGDWSSNKIWIVVCVFLWGDNAGLTANDQAYYIGPVSDNTYAYCVVHLQLDVDKCADKMLLLIRYTYTDTLPIKGRVNSTRPSVDIFSACSSTDARCPIYGNTTFRSIERSNHYITIILLFMKYSRIQDSIDANTYRQPTRRIITHPASHRRATAVSVSMLRQSFVDSVCTAVCREQHRSSSYRRGICLRWIR